MMRQVTILALCFFSIGVCVTRTDAASFTSQTSGDWSSTGTWGGSGVPGQADSVTIAAGTTVHVDGTRSCSTLTVSDKGTLFIDYPGSFNPDILTVSGDVMNEGSLKLKGLLILAPPTSSILRNLGAGNVFGSGLVRIDGNVLLQTDSPFNATLDVERATATVANPTGVTTFNGPIAVHSGALLKIGEGNSIIANLDLYVDGTLDGGNSRAALIMNATFPGSPASAVSFSNNGLITGLRSMEFKSLNNVYLSGLGTFSAIETTTVSSGATVTMESSQNLGALVINGILDQGASASLTAGPITIGNGGLLRNLGTGSLTLAADLTNDGSVQVSGGGPACGDAAKILIRSSAVGTQRNWSGSGTFSLTDVDVQDQAGNIGVTVYGGVKSGNNGSNWTFLNCPNSSGNQIDEADLFVRQQYVDFLNRQADSSGFSFWINEIASCGSDERCIEVRHINVSAAFFLSIEFQQTGYLVERSYKAAYSDSKGASTWNGSHQLDVPMVRFNEFLPDTQKIGEGVVVLQPGWEQKLEDNKQAFFLEFVQRPRFTAAFPDSITPEQFVDRLNQNAGNVLSSSERAQAVSLFGGSTYANNRAACAQVLRLVAENQNLSNAEFNRAFVLMQYFGYLRRDPNTGRDTDYTGYDFWLTKLNNFNGNYISAEMVKAFITSIEYRQRFGP